VKPPCAISVFAHTYNSNQHFSTLNLSNCITFLNLLYTQSIVIVHPLIHWSSFNWSWILVAQCAIQKWYLSNLHTYCWSVWAHPPISGTRPLDKRSWAARKLPSFGKLRYSSRLSVRKFFLSTQPAFHSFVHEPPRNFASGASPSRPGSGTCEYFISCWPQELCFISTG